MGMGLGTSNYVKGRESFYQFVSDENNPGSKASISVIALCIFVYVSEHHTYSLSYPLSYLYEH